MRLRLICMAILALGLGACGTNSAPATSIPPAEDSFSHVQVTWETDSALNLWLPDGDTSTLIEGDGEIIRLLFSPSGMQIAFVQQANSTEQSVWVIDVNGENARNLTTNIAESQQQIGQLIWADDATLYFNTLIAEAGLNTSPQNDLYRAHAASGESRLILSAGEGGNFSLSPDGERLAIVYPGTYNENDGHISLYDLDSGDTQSLLTFRGVATGTHQPFYPTPQWIDETTLYVAIPDPDQLYHEAEDDAPPVQLWRLSVNEESEQIGTIRASLFGLPAWSPDGQQMVFLRRELSTGATNTFELIRAEANGSNPQVITRAEIGAISMPMWVDNNRFVYVHETLNLVEGNGEPRPIGDQTIASNPRFSETFLAYLSYHDNAFTLNLTAFDDNTTHLQIATGLSDARFDILAQPQSE